MQCVCIQHEFVYHVDYLVLYVINKLHMQAETYVKSGHEAMKTLETLTSTDNGWTQKKNQVCTGKACLIDKHWKCHCLLRRAWMSPTLIMTMAYAWGIMSLLHPGSRYPCMHARNIHVHALLEISMYYDVVHVRNCQGSKTFVMNRFIINNYVPRSLAA